jgi:hypothetical protein
VKFSVKLAHSEAVEFETAPKATPKLEQAMVPVPSCACFKLLSLLVIIHKAAAGISVGLC